jgi:hypothetical protein
MAPRTWEKYYEDLFEGVIEEVAVEFDKDVKRRQGAIQRQIEKSKARIPTALANLVNKPKAPQLGKYTPTWEKLSQKWIKKKKNKQFFRDDWHLKKFLNNLDINSHFGQTTASETSSKLDGQVEVVNRKDGSTYRRGRLAAGVRIRDRGGILRKGGQFIQLDKIEDMFEIRLKFTPFPQIRTLQNVQSVSFLEEHLEDDANNKPAPTGSGLKKGEKGATPVEKLKGRQNKHRPLILNYLQWWSAVKLDQIIGNFGK